MKKCRQGGFPCLKFHQLDGFSEDLEHAVFCRHGGVSKNPFNSLNVRFGIGDSDENVQINRKKILNAMNLKQCVSGDQTHSTNVMVLDAPAVRLMEANNWNKIEFDDTDGFVTNQPGLGLMIQVADCQAIIFYDPANKILAAAHAGWRGLKQNIGAVVIEEMEKLGAMRRNILVGISPSLGPLNSEFSDPEKELGSDFMPFVKNNRVDMWSYSTEQLIKAGIEKRRIEIARIDTAHVDEGKAFFSYRRERPNTGRFALVAAIK